MECLQKPLVFWVGETDHKCWMFRGCLKIHLMIKNRLWEQKSLFLPPPKSVCWFKCMHFLKRKMSVFEGFLIKEKYRTFFFPSSKNLDCVSFELCKLCFICVWISVGHLLPLCTHMQIIFSIFCGEGEIASKNPNTLPLCPKYSLFHQSFEKEPPHQLGSLPFHIPSDHRSENWVKSGVAFARTTVQHPQQKRGAPVLQWFPPSRYPLETRASWARQCC